MKHMIMAKCVRPASILSCLIPLHTRAEGYRSFLDASETMKMNPLPRSVLQEPKHSYVVLQSSLRTTWRPNIFCLPEITINSNWRVMHLPMCYENWYWKNYDSKCRSISVRKIACWKEWWVGPFFDSFHDSFSIVFGLSAYSNVYALSELTRET
jgi:hypothetical protein